MTSSHCRWTMIGALAYTCIACEAAAPTVAAVQALDARQAERGAALLLGQGDGPTTYLVDGVAATREAAQAIAPDQIAAVNVNKTVNGTTTSTEIRLITKAGAARGLLDAPDDRSRVVVRDAAGGSPLILIDGRRATKAELDALPPSGIVSVEVVKGAAAVRAYGEAARDGVIKVTTKPAPMP